MKKSLPISLINAMFIFGLFASLAVAAVGIKNESEIAGSWLLESAAAKLGGPKVSRGETWIIGNGQLEKTGLIMARSGTYDVPPVPIKIESGKMLVPVIGRPGKFTEFEVIEKNADSMVLYAKSEGYLFFKQK
ncbi:MAG: hypothetical protein L0Y38_04095 [Methylococcaceae bacterium]|nr:hypothetical protein [Methylococcaceae bacterium]